MNEKYGFKAVSIKEEKAREFMSKVKELAKEYDLPVFAVTDGASVTLNNDCEAVKHARDKHKEFELRNGYDPNEDWGD